MRQLHETARRNPTQRVFNAIAFPTANFRTKTNGEFLDLHAQFARNPEMSELVNENGRAKQRHHGDNYVNDIKNGHVKNLSR